VFVFPCFSAKAAVPAFMEWLAKPGGALKKLNVAYNDFGPEEATLLGEAMAMNTCVLYMYTYIDRYRRAYVCVP